MHPVAVVVAKAIPYFILSLVNLTVIILMAVFLLDMPYNWSVIMLYVVSAVFILCSLAMGLLISNVTASQQVAMMIALMGMMLILSWRSRTVSR